MNRLARAGWRGAWLVVVCLLLAGLPGCGLSPSEQTPGLDSRAGRVGSEQASVAHDAEQGDKRTGFAASQGTGSEKTNADQGNRPIVNPSAMPAGKTAAGGNVPALTIPSTIAKDLDSPDARMRYRALDHWEAKDNKTPLDPVFEAMEDDDPAVRAKATAIVEQYWAAEQEREKG